MPVIIILNTSPAKCSNIPEERLHNPENKNEEKFNPKEFLFDHISDAHEWHILTYKDKHISLYLPVILISATNGIVVFSSKRFHHGHSSFSYKGSKYKLELKGENKGKIIEYAATGTSSIPFDISITKNIISLFFSFCSDLREEFLPKNAN